MPNGLGTKHVVITGGAGGIGRAMAHELVERSAKVTLFDVRPPREPPAASGERLAEAIERGDIGFHQVDVRDRAAVRAALELLDPFDVVIGNAGISQSAPFLDVTDDQAALSACQSDRKPLPRSGGGPVDGGAGVGWTHHLHRLLGPGCPLAGDRRLERLQSGTCHADEDHGA